MKQNEHRASGMVYVPDPKPGERVRIKAMETSYTLPEGLNDGDEVTCFEFDHGYFTVEKDGQRFKVFCGCLDIKSQPWPPRRKPR